MPGLIPPKIWLYRIVHWQNVQYLLQHGMVSREHTLADPDYINFGHSKLIEDRNEHPISGIEGAGTLGEYLPFYFGPHSPMLLMISSGRGGVTKRPQEDIVYIISSLERIKQANCEYYFSDKHAKLALANFYQKDEDLEKIDWEVVKEKYWKNDEYDLDRRDRKQAEFLVRNAVPVSCIRQFALSQKKRKAIFRPYWIGSD